MLYGRPAIGKHYTAGHVHTSIGKRYMAGHVLTLTIRIMELSLLRTFAPGSESTMVWNFRSLELSLPGAKVPRTFAPRNFRSRERKYHGMELSLPGTIAPGSESSKNFRTRERKFQELSLQPQVTFDRDIRSWICTHRPTRLRELASQF